MRSFAKGTLSILVASGIVQGASGGIPRDQLVDLIQRYDRGDYAFVATGLEQLRDVRSFADELPETGADWVRAGRPSDRARRRLLVASLALETAAIHAEQHWYRLKPVLEWACRLLRSSGPPSHGEHLWHSAAIAVIQGAGDVDFLIGGVNNLRSPLKSELARIHAGTFDHLSHARKRFPADPRWQLAEALALEAEAWPVPWRVAPSNLDDGLQAAAKRVQRARDARLKASREDEAAFHTLRSIHLLDQSADRWRTLQGNPQIGAEADLRLGYVQMRLGRRTQALASFRRVETSTDPDLVYLARLFAGWTQDEADAGDSAIAAYRAALVVLPMTPSAAVPLAARLRLSGEREEAARLVEQLATAPASRDPWRLFGRGDYRRWPDLLNDLRASLR
jgi:hypothetical protein